MQPVVRALSILRVLSSSQRGMTLADIAERLSLPPATTHRLVTVLLGEGFVTRSATNRRLFLGPAARELYRVEDPRDSALITPHSALGAVSQSTGETVFLSEVVGTRVVCIALVESRHPLRLYVRIGQEMPLHAAASARVLLAFRSDGEVRRMLDATIFTRFTAETPASIDQVLNRLVTIREQGWDVCDSELDDNVWAVSAPVRASTGAVAASVTVAAPAQRMESRESRDRARHAVLEAAAEMAADLGWIAPSDGGI